MQFLPITEKSGGVPRLPSGEAALREDGVNTVLRAPRNPQLARRARNFRILLVDDKWILTRDPLDQAGVFSGGAVRGEAFAPVEVRLKNLHRPEIEKLERMIACDLSAWKAPS